MFEITSRANRSIKTIATKPMKVANITTLWNKVLYMLAVVQLPINFSNILCNQKVYYFVFKSPHLVCILNQRNPIHIPEAGFVTPILILFHHVRLALPNITRIFPYRFSAKTLNVSIFS
jgi:hypothetical protein